MTVTNCHRVGGGGLLASFLNYEGIHDCVIRKTSNTMAKQDRDTANQK